MVGSSPFVAKPRPKEDAEEPPGPAAAPGDAAEAVPPPDPGISDIRIADFVRALDQVPSCLRAVSLTIRGLYDTKGSKNDPLPATFERLQKGFVREAQILRSFLLPLTAEIVLQLQRLVAHYLDQDFSVWQRQIDDCARAFREFKVMFECTTMFYREIQKDLVRIPKEVQQVRESLVTETFKFQRESGILAIRSLVQDDVFVALLFVPLCDCYAAPYVHGGSKKEFAKPVVAKDLYEAGFATANALELSLLPAVAKLEEVLQYGTTFFVDVLRELEEEMRADSSPPPPPKKRDPWGNFGKSAAEIAEQRAAEEAMEETAKGPRLSAQEQQALDARQLRHFEIFRPKAHWIDRSWRDMQAVAGTISSDTVGVPSAEPADYPLDWLESRQTAAGTDIVDIARAATANVELLACLDPA